MRVDDGLGPTRHARSNAAAQFLDQSIPSARQAFQPLEGEAFDALVADIKANGLRQPITLNGKTTVILDGQNRYRACLAADVEPRSTITTATTLSASS